MNSIGERVDALRSCNLLRDFTDVGLRLVAEAVEPREVGRGTYLFRGGETSIGLCFVIRGLLNIVPREGGVPLGEVKVGDTLGGASLLDPDGATEHLVSAIASTDVALLVLTPKAFEELQRTRPRAALKLTLALAADLAERFRDAKGPLREFLMWQVSKRQAEGRT